MQTKAIEVDLKNSEKNKLGQADRRFHDWYRFVLSFPPHLVRQYIQEFELTPDDIIFDPFCGTGTTLVESKLQRIPSIGIEANPVVHFASSVKTSWNVIPLEMLEIANTIRDKAIEEFEKVGLADDFRASTAGSETPLRGLAPEQEKLLLKNSISPLPLHKSLILLEQIGKFEKTDFYKYFLLSLVNTLVYQTSNLRFGPEVGIGKIKTDSPVVENWFKGIVNISNDLSDLIGNEYAEAKPILFDSRNLGEAILNRKSISAVITSPPYPNEKDYTRTTRLESVVLGFINNKAELRNLKKSLLRSNTRGVYKEDDDDKYVKSFIEVQRIADEIESRRIDLKKTSGFERLYHKVTRLYFGGIAKHLSELRAVLKPNAHLAYVVGDQASYLQVMIRTGHLIAEIAQSLGYEFVRIDLFRTRFSTVTKTNLNEEVVILRWRG